MARRSVELPAKVYANKGCGTNPFEIDVFFPETGCGFSQPITEDEYHMLLDMKADEMKEKRSK